MKYVALLDTETQGLDVTKHTVIEVAVMLYDIQHAQPVSSFASLIRADSNPSFDINGIPSSMLPDAIEPDLVWRAVRWLIGPAEVVIAHNSEFDRKFCPDLEKPWVCSENDIKWPGRARGGSLVHLALSLGLGVANAHRAMADVDTLARILTRLAEQGGDLEALIRHGMRPKQKWIAVVPYERRQEAKDHGFRWDDPTKTWWRVMPAEDTDKLSFPVRLL